MYKNSRRESVDPFTGPSTFTASLHDALLRVANDRKYRLTYAHTVNVLYGRTVISVSNRQRWPSSAFVTDNTTKLPMYLRAVRIF